MDAKHAKYRHLIDVCKSIPPTPTAVVHPVDHGSLVGAIEAARLGLITPILVGPRAKIMAAAKRQPRLGDLPIVDAPHSHAAAATAVQLVHEGQAQALMKGRLHTDELMAAVVSRATGLRTERRVSHCFVMDVPGHEEALIITDAAVNISPTLDEKRDIVQNAIDLAHAMHIPVVRVAILSAMETINPKCRRPSTPPRCARWSTGTRSPAASSTGRSRSTTPSTWRPRKSTDRLAGGGASEHAAGAGPRSGQHAREEPVVSRGRGRRGHRARREGADHSDEPRRLGDYAARVLRGGFAGRACAARERRVLG